MLPHRLWWLYKSSRDELCGSKLVTNETGHKDGAKACATQFTLYTDCYRFAVTSKVTAINWSLIFISDRISSQENNGGPYRIACAKWYRMHLTLLGPSMIYTCNPYLEKTN